MPDALHVLVPVHAPLPPRLFDHATLATPALSEADPPIVSFALLVE
jgi:hypothetical protein